MPDRTRSALKPGGTVTGLRLRVLLAVGLVGLIVVGCSSSKGSSASGGSSPPTSASSAGAAPCAGAPIVIGQIVSVTGAFSFADIPTATKVAVQAVNRACEDGHPFKLVSCNDQNDPNVSVTCAHEIVNAGAVAMVGNASPQLSQAMAVTQAAGIPSLFNAGLAPWEFTNALSYPLNVVTVQALAAASAAAGSGAKSLEILGAEQPLAPVVFALATALAKPFGVQVISQTYPTDTTDFAPVAARALAANPGAIVFGSGGSSLQALLRALSQQGVGKHTLILAPAGLVTPASIAALGSAINGVYIFSAEALPVGPTAANPGITQMRAEYAAAGQSASNSNMTGYATLAWSGVHVLADALKSTTTFTPTSVNAAILAMGTVSQPQIPAFNASTKALPQVAALSPFRVLSKAMAWYRIDNGTLVLLSPGFVPVDQPFNLVAKA